MMKMRTYTGGLITPLSPRAEDIRIEDIAHALACTARFCGHTHEPYSVAQHSVMIAESSVPFSVPGRLAALLHDASEAYICDMPRPVKRAAEMAGYIEIEQRILDAVAERFNISGCGQPWPCDEDAELLNRADSAMLRAEQRDLVKGSESWREGDCLYPPTIRVWPWWEAEIRFLQCYADLTGLAFEPPRFAARATLSVTYETLRTLLLDNARLRASTDALVARNNELLARERAELEVAR